MKSSESDVMAGAVYDFPPFRLDAGRRALLRQGAAVTVPRKALETLLVLVEQRGAVVSKDELLKRVWRDAYVEENNLNQSISALRRALGDSASRPRFIETVAGEGYRFVAEIAAPAAAAPAAPRALAVLPLRTIGGGGGDEWLGSGIADTLIARLSNVHALRVRPTSSVLRYATQEHTAAEAGRVLDVDAVLEGSIRRAGDRIRVTVQLVDVASETPIWASTFDERFTDIFTVEDSISQRVAEALTTRLSVEERSLLTRRWTNDTEAYRLYLNGRWYANRLTQEGSARAIECLEKAVALDPGYAPGYAGLAYLFLQCADITMPSRDALQKAKDAARKALSIDDTLVDARAVLALALHFFDWDTAAAVREFERALALDARSANTHRLYGWSLVLMGRGAEGIDALRRAAELDPLSHENALYVGPGLYFAHRFDEALRCTREVLQHDPELWLGPVMLGRILETSGDLDGAIAAYERAARIDPAIVEPLGDLGRALGLAGRIDEARALLAALADRARTAHVPAFTLANVCLGLGDLDALFAALERAAEERSWYIAWLGVDPALDRVRGDARFTALRNRTL